MKLFVYIGHDGPQGTELRKSVRDRHIAYIKTLDDAGRIRFAGPLRDEAGNPCGSLIVFEAENFSAAQAVAANDPYAVEGVFASVAVHGSQAVFPDPNA